MVYGAAMRNLSMALAVAINAFGPAGSDASLVISLAYVIRVQSSPWFMVPPCISRPEARSRPWRMVPMTEMTTDNPAHLLTILDSVCFNGCPVREAMVS